MWPAESAVSSRGVPGPQQALPPAAAAPSSQGVIKQARGSRWDQLERPASGKKLQKPNFTFAAAPELPAPVAAVAAPPSARHDASTKARAVGMAAEEMRELLTCPISLEIMTDPVSCADGEPLYPIPYPCPISLEIMTDPVSCADGEPLYPIR